MITSMIITIIISSKISAPIDKTSPEQNDEIDINDIKYRRIKEYNVNPEILPKNVGVQWKIIR